jgi:hypothetical protein
MFGTCMRRGCFCNGKRDERGEDVLAEICPVCVIGPYVEKVKPGERLFPNYTYQKMLAKLKKVCKELKLKLPAPVGTHSLRRGMLQTMENRGASPTELMNLGEWSSNAINEYRNLQQAEAAAFHQIFEIELNDDEDSDSDP